MSKDFKVVLYNTEGEGTDVEENYLKAAGYDNYNLVRIDGDKEDLLMAEAADADGLVIMYKQMTKEIMSKFPKCQMIATHSIGVNQVDLKAATELGICVGNVPDYCVEEVAVHTVALMLDCARKITELDRSVRGGKWDVMAAGPMHRTKGKTYGFVSFGNIPRRVAEIVKGFDMVVMAYDPFVDDSIFKENKVQKAETLNELFEKCDYISVHSPLLDQTKKMISTEQFDASKKGTVIICTGRGGVIDENALKSAIESGRIAAAGIDVIEDETGQKSVLMGMDKVVLTPHVAYYSQEACVEEREKAIMQISEVLSGKKPPTYHVNKDVLGHAKFQR